MGNTMASMTTNASSADHGQSQPTMEMQLAEGKASNSESVRGLEAPSSSTSPSGGSTFNVSSTTINPSTVTSVSAKKGTKKTPHSVMKTPSKHRLTPGPSTRSQSSKLRSGRNRHLTSLSPMPSKRRKPSVTPSRGRKLEFESAADQEADPVLSGVVRAPHSSPADGANCEIEFYAFEFSQSNKYELPEPEP